MRRTPVAGKQVRSAIAGGVPCDRGAGAILLLPGNSCQRSTVNNSLTFAIWLRPRHHYLMQLTLAPSCKRRGFSGDTMADPLLGVLPGLI
jgi:hypothetical protein